MQLPHVAQQRRLREHLADQAVEQLLHALERDHLRHQQVQHKGTDTRPVLQRTGHVGWKRCLGALPAVRAVLDLGLDVLEHLLEDDVDARAPFMALAGGVAEIGAAVRAVLERERGERLDRAGVVAAVVRRVPAFGAGARLRRGRVLAVLTRL